MRTTPRDSLLPLTSPCNRAMPGKLFRIPEYASQQFSYSDDPANTNSKKLHTWYGSVLTDLKYFSCCEISAHCPWMSRN